MPQDLGAFNWYIATSPESPFVRNFAVALAPEGKRITIAGSVTRTRGASTATKRGLETVQEFDSALRAAGVEVDGAAIERIMTRLVASTAG